MSGSDRHDDLHDSGSGGRERDKDARTSHERAIDDRRLEDRDFASRQFDAHRFDDRRFDDEVSLRDLYLILVRGLPAILLVAVLAGVGALLVSTVRPASYEAEATVTSSPPSVRFSEDPTVVLGVGESVATTLLPLKPLQGLSVEAYQAIALSQTVLERTRDELGDAAPELGELRRVAEVEATSESGSLLLAYHRVNWNDPELASAYANAWADATVLRVRETLAADLEPTLEITEIAVSQRLAALEAAEAELMALPTGDSSAAASRERARLEREAALARRAYDTVADLAPTLSYLAELVPSGTRVLEPAAPPLESTRSSTMLVTALAVVLGGMAATLFVFLREAVRDPVARTDATSPAGPGSGARTGT